MNSFSMAVDPSVKRMEHEAAPVGSWAVGMCRDGACPGLPGAMRATERRMPMSLLRFLLAGADRGWMLSGMFMLLALTCRSDSARARARRSVPPPGEAP
jgi:hypothetical protein